MVTNIIKGYIDVTAGVAEDYDVKDKDVIITKCSIVTNIFYSADTKFVGNTTEVKLASSLGKEKKYNSLFTNH